MWNSLLISEAFSLKLMESILTEHTEVNAICFSSQAMEYSVYAGVFTDIEN